MREKERQGFSKMTWGFLWLFRIHYSHLFSDTFVNLDKFYLHIILTKLPSMAPTFSLHCAHSYSQAYIFGRNSHFNLWSVITAFQFDRHLW